MTRFVKFAGSLAVAAALFAPALASADDKDVIDYRQHLMNTLENQSLALGQILSTVIPDKNGTKHLQIIALTASITAKAFEPKVEGGRAKPEVWTKHDDFSKKMADFVAGSAKVAKIGQEKNFSEASNNILDALPCKGCHDVYQEPEKKK